MARCYVAGLRARRTKRSALGPGTDFATMSREPSPKSAKVFAPGAPPTPPHTPRMFVDVRLHPMAITPRHPRTWGAELLSRTLFAASGDSRTLCEARR